jgi:hypothetical protein
VREFGSYAKEVAIDLDINGNTLRRWSIELEKAGYEFDRNDKGHRIYYKRDIMALSDFQKMMEKTQSLDNTAKAIVSKVREQNNTEKTLSVIMGNDNKIALTKEELEDVIQKAANDAAEKTATILLEKFNDSIERRDRELMIQIKQQQKFQKQLLETAIVKEKGSFFSWLFSKKK